MPQQPNDNILAQLDPLFAEQVVVSNYEEATKTLQLGCLACGALSEKQVWPPPEAVRMKQGALAGCVQVTHKPGCEAWTVLVAFRLACQAALNRAVLRKMLQQVEAQTEESAWLSTHKGNQTVN